MYLNSRWCMLVAVISAYCAPPIFFWVPAGGMSLCRHLMIHECRDSQMAQIAAAVWKYEKVCRKLWKNLHNHFVSDYFFSCSTSEAVLFLSCETCYLGESCRGSHTSGNGDGAMLMLYVSDYNGGLSVISLHVLQNWCRQRCITFGRCASCQKCTAKACRRRFSWSSRCWRSSSPF